MKPRNTKFLKALGKRIKELREKAGISQDQLGYECDLHRTQINRMEKGKLNAGILCLPAIAKALEIHPRELLDFEY